MTRRQAIALVLCLALVLMRGWARIALAEFWAEDGAIYLRDVLTHGISSISWAFAGSFHILQRFLMWYTVNATPTSAWPHIVAGLYCLIYGGVIAALAGEGLDYLIPGFKVRLLIALLLVFAPGFEEMLGNFSNLNWVLFLWLGCLGLRDPNVKIAWWEVALAALFIFSIGTSILLLPLFIWQTYQRRLWLGRSQAWRSLVILTTIFLVNLVMVKLRSDAGVHGDNFSQDVESFAPLLWRQGPQALALNFFYLMVYHPWLGPWSRQLVMESSWATVDTLARIAFVVFLGWWLMRKRSSVGVQLLSLFAAAVSIWPVLAWFARSNSLTIFYTGNYWGRYAYPTGAVAYIVWAVICLSAEQRWLRWTSLAILTAVTISFATKQNPIIKPYAEEFDPQGSWDTWVPRIDAWRRVRSDLHIPIYPPGWAIDLKADSNTAAD